MLGQKTAANSKTIKVLSFNILHGATMKNDFNLDYLAKVIKDTGADFVAMQEVDNKTNRAKGYDLVTELGWRTKMAPLFGSAMKYDGGEYGEAILSTHSFLESKNIALPHQKNSEPRAALQITSILPSGDTISVIGTHLDHLKENKDRISQAKYINKTFAKNKYPSILVGDLNAQPGSETMKLLETEWTASYNKENTKATYPSNNPTIKIDYVLFRPKNRWRVVKTVVIKDSIASDHCPYLVTLELLPLGRE